MLERAGLVIKERRGREQLVHTDGDAVWRVLDELDAVWRGRVERMAGRPNASSQAFESGVLNLSYGPAS